MTKYVPGLLVTVALAIMSIGVTRVVPQLGGVTWAIILGLLLGNLIPQQKIFTPGVKFAEKKVLLVAIVLMGFSLQFQQIFRLGLRPLILVIVAMSLTILAALLFGHMLGYHPRFAMLMGGGNAVCGSSAIAAIAPVVNADEEEIGLSVGMVNLMGTIGIFLLPALCAVLGLSDQRSSELIGSTLQAVGHVVAAGYTVSEATGMLATFIKMVRVAMLGVVVVAAAYAFKTQSAGTSGKAYKIPPFILGFILCSVLSSIFHTDTLIIPLLSHASKYLLMIAMAGVGMNIRFAGILKHGAKAFVFEVLIFCVQLLCVGLFVMLVT